MVARLVDVVERVVGPQLVSAADVALDTALGDPVARIQDVVAGTAGEGVGAGAAGQ